MKLLREYQRDAVNAIFNYFSVHNGNPLVVIPTGGGKSLIIGTFLFELFQQWPLQRIVILTHRKELVHQDEQELLEVWPQAPIGVYSAGLNRRQLGKNITIAGIQSVYDKSFQVGYNDLILIDEAHLVPSSGLGQYQKFITDQRKLNPYIKVIGFTATPFRLDSGILTEGKDRLFTDVAYEISIKQLIDKGYLAPLVSRTSEINADLSQVTVHGDYVKAQLEYAMTQGDLVERTVKDIIYKGTSRDSLLVFCAGIKHVNLVLEQFHQNGVSAVSITGKTTKSEREGNIELFKHKAVRAIVNCDVLTTGFNAPNIDLLAMLRPTKSTSLYIQMVGRGTRRYPGKENCLVLDYARNIAEHGPVDNIRIKRKFDRKTGEIKAELEKDTATKDCPECESTIAAKDSICPLCGYEFPILLTHSDRAAEIDILSAPVPPKWVAVENVVYKRHLKKDSPDTLKVTYYGTPEGGNMYESFSEWVCLNHSGYPYDKAMAWLSRRAILDCDISDINQSVKQISMEEILKTPDMLLKPKRIHVAKTGNFWEIKEYEF